MSVFRARRAAERAKAEGHWIGKPQNQRLWWGEMQNWFAKYLLGSTPANAM